MRDNHFRDMCSILVVVPLPNANSLLLFVFRLLFSCYKYRNFQRSKKCNGLLWCMYAANDRAPHANIRSNWNNLQFNGNTEKKIGLCWCKNQQESKFHLPKQNYSRNEKRTEKKIKLQRKNVNKRPMFWIKLVRWVKNK